MNDRLSPRLLLMLVALAAVPGCNDGPDANAAPPASQPAAAAAAAAAAPETVPAAVAVPGHFIGRVTLVDGSPIKLPGVE